MTKRLTIFWLIGLLGIGLAPNLYAQEVRAWFDRNPVYEGDTVTLIIETDRQLQNANPDLGPLTKDFDILGNRTNTQLQILNGQQTATTQWLIELEPKHRGDIQVPALQIGAYHTEPLQLTVTAPPPATAQQTGADFFIETVAKPQNPYVQAQIRYTVRLFYGAPLLDGELDEPKPQDALVKRIGDNISYVTTRQQRRYNVLERRYAIFPEKSGELTIPAISFQGHSVAGSGRPSLDLFFNSPRQGRRIRIIADPIKLHVLPRPARYSGKQWLPSAQLNLEETWSKDLSRLQAGEPVTRTVRIEAKGLSAAQLPELGIPEPAQARIYSEQPVLENRIDDVWLWGQREQRMAVVPAAAGQFTIPEIRLTWWDTQGNEQRIATLPARTVTVLPAAGSVQQPIPVKPEFAPALSQAVPLTTTPFLSTPRAAGIWPWIAGTLLLLWLTTLFAWWSSWRRRSAKTALSQPPTTVHNARRALRQACQNNDAKGAEKALLNWATAVWPHHPPTNLGALAARLDLNTAPLKALDQVLYAPGHNAWEGPVLWQTVKQGLPEKRRLPAHQPSGLAPLYPQRS